MTKYKETSSRAEYFFNAHVLVGGVLVVKTRERARFLWRCSCSCQEQDLSSSVIGESLLRSCEVEDVVTAVIGNNSA